MIRRPPRSTLFPTRRSSDLSADAWVSKRGSRAINFQCLWPGDSPAPHPAAPRTVYPAFDVNQVKRSEEHTSELQSRQYLVCRLLLEKKKHEPPTSTTVCSGR